MLHIKLDRTTHGLRGGAEAKIKLFGNMVMLHIKYKLMTHTET